MNRSNLSEVETILSQKKSWELTTEKAETLRIMKFTGEQSYKLGLLVVASSRLCAWGRCWLLDDSIVEAVGGTMRGWLKMFEQAKNEGVLLVEPNPARRGGRELVFAPWFLGEGAEEFTQEQIEASKDAAERIRQGAAPGDMENREYGAIRRFSEKFERCFSKRPTGGEVSVFLSGRRAVEAEARENGLTPKQTARKAREYFETWFAARGVHVSETDQPYDTEDAAENASATQPATLSATQNKKVSQNGSDTVCDTGRGTSNVVVASLDSSATQKDSKTNNNNIPNVSREATTQNPATQTSPPPPTPAQIEELIELLRPYDVTESTVRDILIPQYGFPICHRQAKFLPYREGEDKARIYVASVRGKLNAVTGRYEGGNYARPAGYRQAQRAAEEEKAAMETAERRKAEREARESEKVTTGRKLEDFRNALPSAYRAYLRDCVREAFLLTKPLKDTGPLADNARRGIELQILADWHRDLPALPSIYEGEPGEEGDAAEIVGLEIPVVSAEAIL